MPLGKHTPYNRDSYGNLFGGEMNYSMQDRVVGDTIQDIEARRHQAAMQAQAFAAFPRFMELNDVQLPLYKYGELEDLGKQTLKKRCLDFRDMIEATGCMFFENHEHLRLNAAQGEDKLLEWFINVQVTLAAALGIQGLDHAGLGASHLADTLKAPPAKHNKQQRQPQPQNQQSQERHHELMMQRQYEQQQQQQYYHHQQQQQEQYYQQQERFQQPQFEEPEVENYYNRPPPSRGHPQMKPVTGMHDVGTDARNASRFDDAARIRAKNSGGSDIFG